MATNATTEYDKQNFEPEEDIPQEADTVDNSYATGTSEPVPVMKDEATVEQPNTARRNPDSDRALDQDEKEVINKSNVLRGDRLRHAKPQGGGYAEPGDEEGLPGPDNGRSSVRDKGVEGAYDNKIGG